jgi:branched-subunit amino acid aminotransferase/4-amino-4-deoxychorismate lyase
MVQCFEGMKAYKDSKGQIRMFRPDMNMKRLNNSMKRLAMPNIDGNDDFLELIKKLLHVDSSWIPEKEVSKKHREHYCLSLFIYGADLYVIYFLFTSLKNKKGWSIYIRPTAIGTSPFLGGW